MLGFVDLSGSEPCPRCGSDSGDCAWLSESGRCGVDCATCHGDNVGRCHHCDEVVPCGMSAARNPRQDALCTWRALSRLHGPDCAWTRTRGGARAPLPAAVTKLPRG